MKQGAALMFAHGLNVHFNLIEPRKDLDVLMVAPKGPGHTVRSEYQRGGGVPCLRRDPPGRLRQRARSRPLLRLGHRRRPRRHHRDDLQGRVRDRPLRRAGGALRRAGRADRAGFETLVEAGYAPEMAYFECLHEVKLIVDLIYEGGIANMNYSISNTAEYGEYVSGPRIITAETKAEMKRVLADIQSGKFIRDWMLENKVNQTSFKATRAKQRRPPDRGGRREAARHDALDQGRRRWSTRAGTERRRSPLPARASAQRRSRLAALDAPPASR